MTTKIDGLALSKKIKRILKEKVEKIREQEGIIPGLVVLQVGENPASKVYVSHKEKDALEIGFYSVVDKFSEEITEEELIKKINHYNQEENIHGILVQLPLPKQINEDRVLNAISPEKDVDGFHPINMGKLMIGKPDKIPCTPYGVMKMFEEYNIDLTGKNAVVIGRSNIVGKPMAQLLLAENITVTMAHSRTKNLAEVASQADILVVAIGRAEMIDASFVKEGAVVIDVGMNRNAEGRLVGDVKYEKVAEKASYITPVPGGVGPMTRAMLMVQTYQAATGEKVNLK